MERLFMLFKKPYLFFRLKRRCMKNIREEDTNE
nr:MAG TPA: hypothetical protein [Caudoviricetes sp.]DAQ55944.1 MAG TPA: hypothetical protein [Caudoviricetes sp.]